MTFGEADEGSFMHKVGCDEETSFAIMDRSLEAGVSFWDTANVYGNDGLTERVIGNWFDKTGRRDEVVLASKCRFRMRAGPNGTGASRYQIMEAVEASLQRLKTDHIDLYQIHMQDIDTPEEETLRALDDLVHQGKVRYLGCSNYAAYRMVESLWLADKHNTARYVSLQPRYSLLERSIEREHVPVCRNHGIGIINYSPLAGGFLTGKYQKDQPPPEGARLAKWEERLKRFDKEHNWKVLAAVEEVAKELDTSMTAVAIGWCLRKAEVASVIFGARSVAQLEENLAAADLEIPDELMAKLDEVSAVDVGYPYDFIGRVQKRW
jgi:aryl-alcohol dehydrogenase-like predicted oxidoreductase